MLLAAKVFLVVWLAWWAGMVFLGDWWEDESLERAKAALLPSLIRVITLFLLGTLWVWATGGFA